MTTTAPTTSTTSVDAELAPFEPEPESWSAPPARSPSPPPVPIPVLAPYLGFVAAALCTLGGGWLLLAPYALDLRHGAAHLPRTAAVDLATGAAIVVMGVGAAVFFAASLATRLRDGLTGHPQLAVKPEPEPEPEPAPEPDARPETAIAAEAAAEQDRVPETEPKPESEPRPTPSAEPRQPDPGGALRELLTPLVAALAADLRSKDQERMRGEGNGRAGAPRRQEP